MGIAALFCGLFYGALAHAAYQKAERARNLERTLARLVSDIKSADWTIQDEESGKHAEHLTKILGGCSCGCGAGANTSTEWPWGREDLWSDSTAEVELSKTGFEDG